MVEGILIYKIPFKERDIIGKVLSRRGTLHTFYFYGGQGGGKNQKPNLLELGRMIKVRPAERKIKTDQEIRVASEWSILWEGRKIRENFLAFSLMSFMLELMGKIAVPDDDDDVRSDFEGLFNVISNFLFFLDKALENNDFELHQHLNLSLIKLIYHLGVVPELENCSHCERELNTSERFIFEAHQGGFTCDHCLPQDFKLALSDWERAKKVRFSFHDIANLSYKDYRQVKFYEKEMSKDLLNYLFYHFQLQASNFRSISLLGIF